MLTPFALRAVIARLRALLARIFRRRRDDPVLVALRTGAITPNEARQLQGLIYTPPPVVLRNLPGDHVWARPAALQDPPPILLAHRGAAPLAWRRVRDCPPAFVGSRPMPQPEPRWEHEPPAVVLPPDLYRRAAAAGLLPDAYGVEPYDGPQVAAVVGADTGAALGASLDRDPEPADVQDDRRDDAGTNAGGEA